MLNVLTALWPRSVLPGLRARAAGIYHRYYLRAKFALWQRYSKRRYGLQRVVQAHGENLVVRTNDWRAFSIARTGGTQKQLVDLWKRLAALSPELCVDVGANYGEFSAPIAKSVKSLLVVEANRTVFDCLRQSLGSQPGLSLHNVAITDREGMVGFHATDEMSGYSSLSGYVVGSMLTPTGKHAEVSKRMVAGVPLDRLVFELDGRWPRSVLIKVDVEGFEDVVLKSGANTIGNATAWRAIVEFSRKALENRGVDPETFWRELGRYNGVVIDADLLERHSLRELTSTLPAVAPNHCNVLIGRGDFFLGM